MSDLVASFESELVEHKDRWVPVLPPTVSPDRFKAVVVTALNKNPKLLEADRQSLLTACSQAAHDGLLPDGRDGVLTTFWDKSSRRLLVSWTPMVAGILKRCREKGELTSISAYPVYKQDNFSVVLGSSPAVAHSPDVSVPRSDKDIIASYAVFKNGPEIVHIEVMTQDEIEKARAVSRQKEGAIWRDWYSEMARKTVIRRGSKSVPLSSDIAQIIERDDQWVDFKLAHEPATAPAELSSAEVVDEPHNAELVEALLNKLEVYTTVEDLNLFSSHHKNELDSLREKDKAIIRKRYHDRQRELRK